MGLDTSHDCWHGAYSAFHRWRKEIAKHIGIPLDLMEGFYNHCEISFEDFENLLISSKDETYPSWARDLCLGVTNDILPLKWESFKPNPLHYLLHHSDCDGNIPWSKCRKMANELEKIMPLLPTDSGGGHIGDWHDKTQKFIDGLRAAYTEKQNVIFS